MKNSGNNITVRTIFTDKQIEERVNAILNRTTSPLTEEEVEAFLKARSVFFSFNGENVQADLGNAQYLDRNYTVQQGRQKLDSLLKRQNEVAQELNQTLAGSRFSRCLKQKRIQELQKYLQYIQEEIDNLTKQIDSAATQLDEARANAEAFEQAESSYIQMRGQLYDKLVAWRKSICDTSATANSSSITDYSDAARDMRQILHDFLFIEEVLDSLCKHFAEGGLWVKLDRELMKRLANLGYSKLSVHSFLDNVNGFHLTLARNLANQLFNKLDIWLLVKLWDNRFDSDVLIYSKDWNGKF